MLTKKSRGFPYRARPPRYRFARIDGVNPPVPNCSEEFDVVVMGLGAAGLAEAISALAQGASVCVLEKSDKFGGTTAMSGGIVMIVLMPPHVEACSRRPGRQHRHRDSEGWNCGCLTAKYMHQNPETYRAGSHGRFLRYVTIQALDLEHCAVLAGSECNMANGRMKQIIVEAPADRSRYARQPSNGEE